MNTNYCLNPSVLPLAQLDRFVPASSVATEVLLLRAQSCGSDRAPAPHPLDGVVVRFIGKDGRLLEESCVVFAFARSDSSHVKILQNIFHA